MTPRRYRRKPIGVEAVQWTGENEDEISAFFLCDVDAWSVHHSGRLLFDSIEGAVLSLPKGGWLVKSGGVVSERFPDPAEFEATYGPVEEPAPKTYDAFVAAIEAVVPGCAVEARWDRELVVFTGLELASDESTVVPMAGMPGEKA